MSAHLYHVDIAWQNDRQGLLCSPEFSSTEDGNSCLTVATPPPFPHGTSGKWSPEHLFTAAVSSCLMTTFLAIAENSKLDFISFDCSADGKLDQVEGKWLMTEVMLKPVVHVRHEKDREKAMRVLQKSEAACLISNSVKAKVEMDATVISDEILA